MTLPNFTPRRWQRPMIDHLFQFERSALWAGMGTGKTAPVLALLDALYMSGESHPTLILGPLRVVKKVWTNEAAKWNDFRGLSIVPVVGSADERHAALRIDAPIYTCNYDNLPWLVEHFGDRWPFRTVVADESDNLKGHRVSEQVSTLGKVFYRAGGASRAAALAKIAHTKIKRFYELTGTPSSNGLTDLWGQLWYLDKGRRLGNTYEAFFNRWFKHGHDGRGVEPLGHADAEIHALVGDICKSIDIRDWTPIDEPLINNVIVDMPRKARKIYHEMQEKLYAEIDDRSVEAFNGAAKTQKLLQLANGAVYVDPLAEDDQDPRSKEWKEVHDEKILALKEIASETGGRPLLVFYEFKSDLARLLKAFPRGKSLNDSTEELFKTGTLPMLFVHPKSASHGIDGWQQNCCDCVFFGHNWSLGRRLQAIERIGPTRQLQAGTGKKVTIHNIIMENSVDELVMLRHETKREVQELLLESCKLKGKK